MKTLKHKKLLIMSILALSLPAIIEMGLNTMLGVSDTIMLGQLISAESIASAGFSNQIIFLLIFTFSAFNTGAIAMISRAYGEKDFVKLKHIAEQNVLLNLLMGILIFIFTWFIKDSALKIYDIEPEVYDQALIYFRIILFGLIPMFLSFSFAAILRGSGNTKTPMYITGVVNIINIMGNYVLITGVGPFPKMGIAGAAWATTLSRLVAAAIYIYILYIAESKLQLKVKIFFDKKIIKPLFRISWPGAIEQGLMQLSFVVSGIFIAKLDTNSESVFRILIQIESLSFMPAVGISIAAATLVGKSIGEKDIPKGTEIGFASAFLGVAWGVFIAIIFIIFPKPLLQAFTSNAAIITLGIGVVPFLALNQPGLNYMIVMGGALRGAGDTKILMYLTISRLWLVFIPLAYLFIITLNKGVAGLWYGEIISILLFSIILFFRFKNQKWSTIEID